MATDLLDGALADCAGDGAADALSDGPWCRLSAVEKRCDKRLLSDVWEHDPTHADIRALLGRLNTALGARGLPRCGVTTDGAARSPVPRREVCGKGRHPIGPLPVIKDIVKAGVGAVASARQGLAAQQPTRRRGRPSPPAAPQAARTNKRWAAPGAALFTPRSLFVPRHRNPTERTTLWRVRRGWPQ